MPRSSKPKDLSLKWLELFHICAQKGSLQTAAQETGLTVSTVSYHLSGLEDYLGVALFDHQRRPMILTPKGQAFLRNIDGVLHAIRKATAEASAGNIADASYLRIGAVEDFEMDITPDMAVFLANYMPDCDFTFQTDTSAAILEQLRNRKLEIGVSASLSENLGDVQEQQFLRDPFVVVTPAQSSHCVADVVSGKSNLKFLRFSNTLIIGRQIEAQLKRIGMIPGQRFECASSQTLMAMVAAGAGWAITTPLLFSRATRFQDKLDMHPFPGKSFARTLSILSTPDCSESVVDLFEAQIRRATQYHAIDPLHLREPWLKDSYGLIN